MAEIGLMLIGSFYVYAGVVATRGAFATALFDRALAQNAGRETPPLETLRTIWLVAGSVLIAASGLALALLSTNASWLFVTAAVVQGSYLHIATPFLFKDIEAVRSGSQRVARIAYMIFVAATLLVLIAERFGRLKGIGSLPTPYLVVAAIMGAAITGYGLWRSGPTPGDEL